MEIPRSQLCILCGPVRRPDTDVRMTMSRRFLLLATALVTVALCPSTRLHSQAPDADIDINLTEGTGMAAVASPDRRSIAVDFLGALWVLPVGGGEAKRITRTPSKPVARHGRRTAARSRFRGTTTPGTSTRLESMEPGSKRSRAGRSTIASRTGRVTAGVSRSRRTASAAYRPFGRWTSIRAPCIRCPAYIGNDPCWSPSDHEVVFFGRDPHDAHQPIAPPGLWVASPDGTGTQPARATGGRAGSRGSHRPFRAATDARSGPPPMFHPGAEEDVFSVPAAVAERKPSCSIRRMDTSSGANNLGGRRRSCRSRRR